MHGACQQHASEGLIFWYRASRSSLTIWSMPIEHPKQGFVHAPVLPKRQRAILVFLAHPQVLASSRQEG